MLKIARQRWIWVTLVTVAVIFAILHWTDAGLVCRDGYVWEEDVGCVRSSGGGQ